MDMVTAPTALREPIQCANCEDGTYVLHRGDKVCRRCGHLAGTGKDDTPDHPWFRWRVIRNTKFEENQDYRKRVVGSYIHAYLDDDSGSIVI